MRTLALIPILSIALAACAEDAAGPLSAPEHALSSAVNASQPCVYEGSADYAFALRPGRYCAPTALERWLDEDGVVVEERELWLSARLTGDEEGDDFDTAESTASSQGDGFRTCFIRTGRSSVECGPLACYEKGIFIRVPDHVECPRELRVIRPRP